MIGIGTDIAGALNKLDRVERALQRGTQTATREATDIVGTDVRRRVRVARRINVQDSAAARTLTQRSPVSTSVNPSAGTGLVVLKRYWTPVRSNVLISVYDRLGLGKQLRRPGLWVKPTNARSKTRRTYESRQGLRYTRFSYSPTLAEWASRRDRGFQLLRHAVQMDPRAAIVIVANPATVKTRPDALACFARAAARGVRA